MKTVFSNSMVAHVWAQQSQAEGRNAAGSISFDQNGLYSYKTRIALLIGVDIALISSEGFSATTAGKHIPAALRAVDGRTIFRVPVIEGSLAAARQNVDYLERKYTETFNGLMRCPADSPRIADAPTSAMAYLTCDGPTYAHDALRTLAKEIVNFRALFCIAGPVLDPDESANMVIARRDRLRADPKRVAKAAAGAAAREIATARRREVTRQYDADMLVQALDRWNGDYPVYLTDTLKCAEGGALLRLSAGGYEVETSWGATVPVIDARRVLKFYDHIRAEQAAGSMVTWGRSHGSVNTDRLVLGHFTLDKINADGSIRVGCHTIYASQIEHLRSLLERK